MNDELTKELIDTLKNQKRPETITAPIYGLYSEKMREFVYSDSRKDYDTVDSIPEDKEVRSVKAFALSIAEELKRRGNSTGEKATVKINLSGGVFIPDDDFGGYRIVFKRLNSQQWNLIKNYINRTIDHSEFLLLLQGLKPSFQDTEIDFHELFGKYSSLKIVGESRIVSNPIITEKGQEKGFVCRYKLEDGTDGEECFPSGFVIKVPFAKAGDFSYYLPIDLMFARDKNDEISITVLCPEFENIEEKAIIDEAEFIKEQTSKYTDLLVLSDF